VRAGLFTLRGRGNTVKNFTMQYFPSGIHVRAGSHHEVSGVTDRAICDQAVTVDSALPPHSGPGAGRHIVIANNTFVGNTPGDANHTCSDAQGRVSPCGLDKAIQVNGGETLIVGNVIDAIGQPVEIIGGLGTHTLVANSTRGDAFNQNVCQAYTVTGAGSRALFTGNRIDYCKYGIRVLDGATVEANDNTITNAYESAFEVRRVNVGGALLKGAGNRVRHAGYFTVFTCALGAVVDLGDTEAHVDLGGGDFAGSPVLGGTISPGGNVFCQGPLAVVWNAHGCAGDPTAGGSIGIRSSCADLLPPLVLDAAPPSTSLLDVTTCAPGQCDF
jgi:hypothetical protein